MTDQPVHRLYRHFQQLPLSMRVMFTGTLLVLGLGYAFAALYVYAAHSGADGETGLSLEDIKITYSGSDESTHLETALRGSMSGMVPSGEREAIYEWIRGGADKSTYESRIRTIVDDNCLSCHDGSNPHLSKLEGFENIQLVVAKDTGADLFTLVRVSHIHLFGLTFIFFMMGFIFSHAYIRPVWIKVGVIASPLHRRDGRCAGVVCDQGTTALCMGGSDRRHGERGRVRRHVVRIVLPDLVLQGAGPPEKSGPPLTRIRASWLVGRLGGVVLGDGINHFIAVAGAHLVHH